MSIKDLSDRVLIHVSLLNRTVLKEPDNSKKINLLIGIANNSTISPTFVEWQEVRYFYSQTLEDLLEKTPNSLVVKTCRDMLLALDEFLQRQFNR